nr:RHS repeat domain-containing protein [uncultured Flavobacterium sp.]
MKKIYSLLFCVIMVNLTFAQDLQPKSFMFSSMGDFTNFPVATATGLPDINLPLFSVPTASPDFNLDLKLQYNLLSNINANITGGQFGSAWNLNIEGAISREVRGRYSNGNVSYLLPDELYFANNTNNRETSDLYSYNFFGNTGKFYLKIKNGAIIPVLYESNSYVEIKVNYDIINKNFTSIEILDATGKKFVFGYQTSISFNIYYTSSPKGDNNGGYQPPTIEPSNPGKPPIPEPAPISGPEPPGFITSINYATPFWKNLSLTKVYDRFNKLIVDYSYEDLDRLEGRSSFLKKIDIKTVGSIEFVNTIGNSTSNKFAKNEYIVLKNLNNEIVNKLKLEYGRLELSFKNGEQKFNKLLLQKISVFGKESISKDITEVFYKKTPSVNYNNAVLDDKGYIVKKGTCKNIRGKESILSTYGILQKIKFNTGGVVLYDFEPNTYSNARNSLDDFRYQNLDNYIFTNYTPIYNNQIGAYAFQVGNGVEKIIFGLSGQSSSLSIARPGESNMQGSLVYGSVLNPEDLCISSLGYINTNGITGLYRLPTYNPNSSNLFLKGVSYPTESNTNKFLYSHGLRIKRIAYFEGNVSQNLLQNNASVPNAEREITFNYSADDAGKISSGKTHSSEQYSSEILDSYVLYEKVTTKVRGIGKSEYYFNNVAENANFWRSLNVIPKKIKTYNNSSQLIKEQEYEREFKYYSNQPNNVTLVSREPIVYKEQVKSKEYIEGNIAEFISNITNDTISRQVIYSKNTNLKTNEINETYNNFIKINKTYVLDKSDNYFNGSKTMSSKNTYDANANLRFQEVSKNNQPLQKVGNENTLFNSRGNVLEYIQPNGTYVVNMYGYEGTKLVAQLVNAKYADISKPTITSISKFSNETGQRRPGSLNIYLPVYNEANLISNLNSLRINHPNAFVTTYIYNTLIGVKSITDPNGDTQTFEYDNQNRLVRIKDHQGNTLNSYQYNFKN